MDMINDLTNADAPSAARYVPALAQGQVLERTQQLIDQARGHGARVGFVRVGFSRDYRECNVDSPIFARAVKAGILQLNTWGTEIHPIFSVRPEDADIVKHRVSPFHGSSLEVLLRSRGINRLILCGVSTNGVVHTGAREAHDRDYDCVVVPECCAAASPDEHERALACLSGYARFASVNDPDLFA